VNDSELWTYQQVAARIQCCVRKVRDDYVKLGLLKCVRLGRSVRFRPSDVEAFIASLASQAVSS
jgi:hypothetical protein